MKNIHNWYNKPTIFFSEYANKTEYFHLIEKVCFRYNSYGYRTNEFDDSTMSPYVLCCGCSLTEGHGLHYEQTWPYKFSENLNINLVNLAKGGSNSDFVAQNVYNWLKSDYRKPKLIVLQWPNPYRILSWNDNKFEFVMNSSNHNLQNFLVKHHDFNFWHNWSRNILWINNIIDIPVINFVLEDINFIPNEIKNILEEHNIRMHYDEKLPEKSWHFDSNALDNSHHSDWCTSNWTNRLLTIYTDLL